MVPLSQRRPGVAAFLVLLLSFTLLRAPGAVVASESQPVPIYDLQGDGPVSPYRGLRVDAVGVVTAVTQDGFYFQDAIGDGRPETSDGIFVYTRKRSAVRPGDCIRVSGAYVDEFFAKTELSRSSRIEPSTDCPSAEITPEPLPVYAPGRATEDLYEPLEGMLVVAHNLAGRVHGPTRRYRNGDVEIALLPAHLQPYVTDGRIFQSEADEMAGLLYVSGLLGNALPDANHGDWMAIGQQSGEERSALAVLDYNFGKYQLLLLPRTSIEHRRLPRPEDVALPATDSDFTVCTFNLMGLGRGTEQYPDPATYTNELRKRARTIAEALGGCTIIGLQELGAPADADALAEMLRRDFDLDYVATAEAGPQSLVADFPLTNGVLTRRDRVKVVASALRQGCSSIDYGVPVRAGSCSFGSYPLFNRPPLVVDLVVGGEWGEPVELRLITNHWKSKVGNETVNVQRRHEQATFAASLAQEWLAEDPDAAVVLLGDLNDFYDSAVIERVRTAPEPDLIHAFELLPTLDRYTYIYNGGTQALDHILASPALLPWLVEVNLVHMNADFAAPANPRSASVHHASDHDPVLVRFQPAGGAWLAGNVGYPNVEITLIRGDGSAVATAVSDTQGEFRLWGLDPGAYQLKLAAPDYLTLPFREVAIPVNSGDNRWQASVQHRTVTAGAAAALLTAQPDIQP